MTTKIRKIVKERRDYNTWVVNETLEDYSLRYAPKSFRKWSEFLVANTALGGISFLALEAIGGSLVINYGFTNSFWAIITVGIIIFLAGLPISYYASKYNIDIDLLTRGAGFGYIGSTITSLVYASFTFIFFALEAAIMAQALELYFHLPLSLGYIFCSLIILPIVFYGVTLINQLHLWTQPLWLTLMILPYIFVIWKEPDALTNWFHFAGNSPSGSTFNPLLFGAAATVSFSLIAQLGEQVDYLRFLPDKTENNRFQWWVAVILAGPGWIILGVAKQLGGAFLTSLAIEHGKTIASAKQPIQMYLTGFADIFSDPNLVLSVAVLFVIVSQIKINATNAYAGSLAWSNFFSRLTHSHPGRVVWLVFNIFIALLLMELGVFETIETVLGLYSNVAIAWIGAIVADLVINKPLGISPSYIEFKRAYLYDFNPVGFGSMAIASVVSILAFVGVFGIYAQAYAPFIAMGLAFVLSPLFAFITKGKYYIARENIYRQSDKYDSLDSLINCCICEQKYEPADTAFCPIYDTPICSLCCSLDARCHDRCKTDISLDLENIATSFVQSIFRQKLSPLLSLRIVKFLGKFTLIAALTGLIVGLVYYEGVWQSPNIPREISEKLIIIFWVLYAVLLVLIGIGTWLLVLSEESRELAESELDKQNLQLQQEISDRHQVEVALLKSEERFQLTMQSVNEGIWDWRLDTNEVYFSPQWKIMLGYEDQEIVNTFSSWEKLVHPDDIQNAYEAINNHLTGKSSIYHIEFRMLCKDGSYRWILSRAKAVEKNAKNRPTRLVGAHTDITDRKLTEIELQQAKLAAEVANQAKSEFLTNMSHELRTPLNGILGYAQILMRSKSLQETELKGLEIINQCGTHLLTLINDILDLSKVEAGKMELNPTELHFPSFLQGVSEICRIKAEQKGITFINQFDRSLPISVQADEKRLRQVLINLLGNAVKFTDTGGVTFKVGLVKSVAVESEANNLNAINKIRFQIEDTGVGMSYQQMQKIFSPFEQVGDIKRKSEGTGLGLAISSRIVQKMESNILVTSQLGAGSTFWFDLDLPCDSQFMLKPTGESQLNIIGYTGNKQKILVVDDRWENRSVIASLLTPIGFEVFEAANGSDGLEIATALIPDAIIVDLVMPVMDGFELLRHLRNVEELKDLVVIVSSASVFESSQYESLDAGANAFLPKPVQVVEILELLQKHLKLSWVYAESTRLPLPTRSIPKMASIESASVESLMIPPPEIMEILYDLAKKGNMKGLMKQAEELKKLNEQWIPFAERVCEMAKGFQEKQLQAFLNQYQVK